MSNSLLKVCCVSINLSMCTVYVNIFIFFLNAYLFVGTEIPLRIKLIYCKMLEQILLFHLLSKTAGAATDQCWDFGLFILSCFLAVK